MLPFHLGGTEAADPKEDRDNCESGHQCDKQPVHVVPILTPKEGYVDGKEVPAR